MSIYSFKPLMADTQTLIRNKRLILSKYNLSLFRMNQPNPNPSPYYFLNLYKIRCCLIIQTLIGLNIPLPTTHNLHLPHINYLETQTQKNFSKLSPKEINEKPWYQPLLKNLDHQSLSSLHPLILLTLKKMNLMIISNTLRILINL